MVLVRIILFFVCNLSLDKELHIIRNLQTNLFYSRFNYEKYLFKQNYIYSSSLENTRFERVADAFVHACAGQPNVSPTSAVSGCVSGRWPRAGGVVVRLSVSLRGKRQGPRARTGAGRRPRACALGGQVGGNRRDAFARSRDQRCGRRFFGNAQHRREQCALVCAGKRRHARAVVGCADGSVLVAELAASGKVLTRTQLASQAARVNAVTFAPGSSRVLAADEHGRVALLSARRQTRLAAFDGNGLPALCVSTAQTGGTVAAGDVDGGVHMLVVIAPPASTKK